MWKELQHRFYVHPVFSKKFGAKPTTGDNKRGRFINKVLCWGENKLLQEAIAELGRKHVVAPMFDGLLVLNNHQPTATLELLNAHLPVSKEWRIKWDMKPHDSTIVVDPNQPDEAALCMIAETDIKLIEKMSSKLHSDGILAHCRGATWLVGDTTVVALASDRAANAHLQNRLYGLLTSYELVLGSQQGALTDASTVLRLAQRVAAMAIIDDDFEAAYWAKTPRDNYSQSILSL
eukprot:COSAG06_NODE_18728_length_871_cov_2.072539_2_plen_233_part_01